MEVGSALMGASRLGLPTSALSTCGLDNPLLWGLFCVCGMFTGIPGPCHLQLLACVPGRVDLLL